MIAGVLGAIDGRIEALRTALAHVEEQGIHVVLQTGNIAVGHEGGGEAVALLREHGIAPVQGELDRLLVRYARKREVWRSRLDVATLAQFDQALDRLGSAQLEWLGALPRHRQLEIDGVSLYVCHGAPGSQSEILAPDTPRTRLERHRETAPVDFLVCGGAPATFDRLIGGTSLVCPGPLYVDGHAEFVVLHTEEQTSHVSRVRLPL